MRQAAAFTNEQRSDRAGFQFPFLVADNVVIALGPDIPLILRPVAGKPHTVQFLGQAYIRRITWVS